MSHQLTLDGMPTPSQLAPAAGETELSPGARRTLRQKAAIEAGRHPANGLPINTDARCGDCAHLKHVQHGARTYLKCEHHALGVTFSEASDMRASWPACPRLVPR